ncbi:Crp/Fnr family transcriptional regulator [Chryseobacterium soli]|uniref:Crp/Fnr family transcriptional regulator n=1 Tax=Chryseobacterium soli TaxID=445961 RepID=UPI002954E988|nr:Crp/Fnr family transcriptional regulator [Chryseobacterium soli]MDV7697853.1 Crp/Fnr family transcriptional regulator [Chryseobacterium soli]
MTDQNIINSIKLLTGFTDEELGIVMKYFVPKNIKKKTILLEAGITAKEIYFVISGCIRLFYTKDGKDISAYFFTEKMFAGAYDSFISKKPSRHSIETLEDCQILTISDKASQELYTEFPKMNEFVRKVLEERFVSLHELYTSQILDTPEERYVNLLNNRPELINRIPQHQIATFLGITPVSLSRIRNRILKK